MERVAASHDPRTTLVLTSLPFGLLHCVTELLGFPHRFVAGIVFGWLRMRSGSLLPSIGAHAMNNALAAVAAGW